MTTHLIAAPVVLPALAGALLLLLGDGRRATTRIIGLASAAALLLVAALLLGRATGGTIETYALGDWAPPFGIVLVLDRLSALLVLLTSLVGLAALAYAVNGWDTRGRHFHALFQFQLMGLNGAFLTGDLFNLFVFFEVLLIASYCLLAHGLGAARLRAGVHYVAINLTGSAVFLIAVSLLYGVTGTLNMAHLAERVAAVDAADVQVVRASGLMLLGVFSVKAALFPLYFWLPATYAAACAPVAALFSLMTKVGVYAIVRVSSLVFAEGPASELTQPWLVGVAMTTLVLGALGVLAAEHFARMVAYLTLSSVGTMLIAVSLGTPGALAAALFYLTHSTLVIAALFLLVELVSRQRGATGDAIRPGPTLARPALTGLLLLVAAATVAGLPPFSGFVGKLMVLRSAQGLPIAAWVWTAVFVASFITLIGCARSGMLLVWSSSPRAGGGAALPPARGEWLPLAALLACGALMVAFAAPLKGYLDAAAAQVSDPRDYAAAVLRSTPDHATRPLPARGP